MPNVSGRRSCHAEIDRLVNVGHLFDKIRLRAAGQRPSPYVPGLGQACDVRACAFLRVGYSDLRAQGRDGADDVTVLARAGGKAGRRSDAECEGWSFFMLKRGWRDASTATLQQRIGEYGLSDRLIETWFDLNDFDEGRDPVAECAWEKC